MEEEEIEEEEADLAHYVEELEDDDASKRLEEETHVLPGITARRPVMRRHTRNRQHVGSR